MAVTHKEPPFVPRPHRNELILSRLASATALVALLSACASAPEAASPSKPTLTPSAQPTAPAPAILPAPTPVIVQPPAPVPAPLPAPVVAPAPSAGTAPEVVPAPLPAPEGPAKHQTFAQWLQAFEQRARDAGISEATVSGALDGVRFVPRIVELDRAQPEFTRPPWVYLDNAISQARIDQGKLLMKRHKAVFDGAEREFGVPASVITAIWGMESNFGRNFGSFRAVDAFATLAYDGRRSEWASRELLIALKIIDRGDIAATQMLGSWAGAMGHTQFLPSAYQRFAVDADGDGRRDIWGSIPDVIYSTANFLAQSGWRTGESWGVEVELPARFDYARAEIKTIQSAAAWAAEGVRTLNGAPLPPLENASIVTPAGARGPAILVGDNFRALLRYNNSINYALAVGLLARQINGGTGLTAAWPRDLEPLSRSEVRQLQEALNARGFDTGAPDGVAGPATRIGVRDYQKSAGIPADGFATKDLLQKLLSSPQ